MSATDELRKLLDERGVEYRIECKQTRATFEPFNRFIVLNERGGLRGTIDVYLDGACNCTWEFDGLTPEQAIAATLGRGTCEYVIDDNMNETEGMGDVWFRCTNCDTCYDYYADEWLLRMPYCPQCSAKVVEQ